MKKFNKKPWLVATFFFIILFSKPFLKILIPFLQKESIRALDIAIAICLGVIIFYTREILLQKKEIKNNVKGWERMPEYKPVTREDVLGMLLEIEKQEKIDYQQERIQNG